METEPSLSARGNQIQNTNISEDLLFEVLSHRTRRQILKELGRNLICSYSMLKAEIKVSTGVLYHHLQKLMESNLVMQRPDKEYELTPLGRGVVQFLEQNRGKELILTTRDTSSGNAVGVFFQDLLESIPFASIVFSHKYHLLLETILILAICYNFQLQLGLWFFGPFLIPIATDRNFPIFLVYEGIGILINIVFTEGSVRILFGRKENAESLMIGIFSLATFPAISIILLWISSQLNPSLVSFFYWPTIFLLQILYMTLGAQLIVKLKKLSWDRAMLVSLFSLYLFLLLFQIFLV